MATILEQEQDQEQSIEKVTEEKVFSTTVDLTDLYNKYKDSPYMLNRLQTFITNLPNLLDAENKRYEERVLRMNELTMEQDNFFKVYF